MSLNSNGILQNIYKNILNYYNLLKYLEKKSIIIVHNHPSGDTKPSRGDIEMTQAVKEVSEKLGIQLHDHVIVGKSGASSFKSMGLL